MSFFSRPHFSSSRKANSFSKNSILDIKAKMAMCNLCNRFSMLPILKTDYTKMNNIEKISKCVIGF